MTWEYLPVLNSLLQILLTIAVGSAASFLGILSETFIQQAVTFVFYVALPSLIIKGIATGIDFYNDKNVWPFIVAFLILRFIALILAFLVILFTNWKQKRRERGLGHVAVLWLSLTWISTVILGVPICAAGKCFVNRGITYMFEHTALIFCTGNHICMILANQYCTYLQCLEIQVLVSNMEF